MRPLNILIYEPYTFKISGNTRYLATIFKFLDKSRFNPILATPVDDGIFPNIIRDMGGRCMILPTPSGLKRYGGSIMGNGISGKFLAAANIARHSADLVSFIRREKIDLIQCHNLRALMTVSLAAKLTRKPCFWYVKGHLNNKLADRIGFSLADRILFQCETNKRRKYPELVKKFSDKIRILKNGIDLNELIEAEQKDHSKLEAELRLSRDKINIILSAVVCRRKGAECLIEAMGKIRQAVPSVMLYMVGDHGIEGHPGVEGDTGYKRRLDKLIEARGLRDIITFTGWRPDAVEIMSLMDISVLPSLDEGVPKSILEGMALGKPVVATDVGGVAETVINGQTGFVVKPGDVEGLAQAIITLAKDKELRVRFGERARQIAFRDYSILNNIAGLERLYEELANE